MKQQIPHSQSELLAASTSAIKGALRHAATIQLAYNNAAVLTTARKLAVDASDAHDAAVRALRDARMALKGHVAAVRGFAMLARDLLKASLGRSYNLAWAGTGFVGSLEVSEKTEELEVLVETLSRYLADHPEKQSVDSHVTATEAAALYTELHTTRLTVLSLVTDGRILGQKRSEAFLALRKRLLALAKELEQVISKTDPCWLDYGLNIPGQVATPEAPENITVATREDGSTQVKWDAAPLAKRYAVWALLDGVAEDSDWLLLGTTRDLMFVVESSLPGNAKGIAVSAGNRGGYSRRSEVRTFAVEQEGPDLVN